MSLLEKAVQPFAYLFYRRVLNRERALGYKLNLNPDKSRWLGNGFPFDMSATWKKFGLEAIGINYLTVGSLINNNLSSRFDISSPYYQAWLGGYIVRFTNSRDWAPIDHFKLGVADQKVWLNLYGVKNPKVEFDLGSVENLGEFNISNYNGKIYKMRGRSNTDVGNNYNKIYLSATWAGGCYFLKRYDPGLVVNYKSFIPAWTDTETLSPYQVIDLEGYVAILEVDERTKAVLYVNGARFTDKNAKVTDNFKMLDKSLLEDLKRFRIVKI